MELMQLRKQASSRGFVATLCASLLSITSSAFAAPTQPRQYRATLAVTLGN